MLRHIRSTILALSFANVIAACSSDTAAPSAPSAAAGSSTQPSSGGSSAGYSPVGGATGLVSGGANAGGANAGGANAGGTSAGGTSAGGTSAGGTSAGGTSASGTSAGGTLGNAGASGSGASSGGSAGAGDALAAAAILNGYQLLDPCQAGYHAVSTPGDVCPQDASVKNQKIPLQFGGTAGVTYNVTLHVRGVMEGYWYSGGTLDAKSQKFYTGGVPTIGGFASACKNKTSELPFTLPSEVAPVDDCWNGFNMFALTVSAPAQHYYLNYTADMNGDRQPHTVYTSDYTVTIPIQGQAKLEFYIIGSDEHECYNFNTQITGITTKPNPYIGDFVQFDVTKVETAP